MPSLDLIARFIGVDAGMGSQFDKFGAQSQAAAASWKKFGIGAATAAAVVGLAAIDMADKFEVSRTMLEGAIANVGGNFNALKGRVAGVDSSMEHFGFTNTETEAGLANLTTATKNPAAAMKLMGLAADLARGRNMSLADSTSLLVKVETGHVALLARLGINTKNAAGATLTQQQALQRLTDLYGGDATRYSKTFSGQLQTLKAQSQDLGKNLGLVLIPALSDTIQVLDSSAHVVSNVSQFFEDNKNVTLAVAGALTGTLVPALLRTTASMSVAAVSGFGDALAGLVVKIVGTDAALSAASGETSLFTSMLNPMTVGLALVGAAGGEAFMQIRDREREAKQSAEQFVASLKVNSDSLSSLGTGLATLKQGIEILKSAPNTLGVLNRTIAAYNEQWGTLSLTQKTVAANEAAISTQFGLSRARIEELAAANGIDLTGSYKAVSAAISKVTSAAQQTHQPLSTAASDFASLSAKTSTLSDDITSLDGAWNALVGNLVSADQARTTVINDEKAWRKAIEASSGSISNQTKLGQAARAMLNQTTNDIHTQSDAITNNNGTYAQAAAPIKAWIKQIEASGATGPFVKKLVAGLKADLAGLKGAGQTSGAHLGDGLIIGINSKDQAVAKAANHLGSLAISEANRAMGNKSPSTKMIQAGKWLAQGLIIGWTGESAKIKDALSTPVQNALDHLQTVMNNALTKQQNALKTAHSNLSSLLSSRRSDISNLSGTISGAAGISGIFGTDANGNATTANVGQFLGAQVGPIEAFAKDLKWAEKHHLAPALLSQIANLGAVQGDQVLKQFMSGASSIAVANQAEAAIDRYSGSAARGVEDSVYAKRVAKDEKNVHEQTELLREVRDDMRKLAREAGKDSAKHFTLELKGGNLQLTDHNGREIVRILRKLEATGVGVRGGHK